MRISVVCPVYDTPPALLREAVASVLRHPSDTVAELVLADDASTDPATLAALAELVAADPRVRLVRLALNGGPSCARDLAVAAATGDWIGFVDSDDLWVPDGLSALLDAHRGFPAYNWIAANTAIMECAGDAIASIRLSSKLPGLPLGEGLVGLAGAPLTRVLIGGDWLHLGTCLIRRESLLAMGGFAGNHVYSEDWLLFLRLSVAERLLYVERETYLYRRQQPSLTTASPRRLSAEVLSSTWAAFRDPILRPFRRELRWTLYRRGKALAAENLMAGRRLAALRFAFQAWLVDPREIADLILLVRAICERNIEARLNRLRRYTTAALASQAR